MASLHGVKPIVKVLEEKGFLEREGAGDKTMKKQHFVWAYDSENENDYKAIGKWGEGTNIEV